MKNTLRKYIALITIIIGSLYFWGCSSKNDRIIGEWTGYHKITEYQYNDSGIDKKLTLGNIIFDKSNHLYTHQSLTPIKTFNLAGHKLECKYETNYKHDPNYLDFVFYEVGKNDEVARTKGIFRFISDSEIELRMNPKWGSPRFEIFDTTDKEYTVVLDKVSQ
jgi:hypothetical protein